MFQRICKLIELIVFYWQTLCQHRVTTKLPYMPSPADDDNCVYACQHLLRTRHNSIYYMGPIAPSLTTAFTHVHVNHRPLCDSFNFNLVKSWISPLILSELGDCVYVRLNHLPWPPLYTIFCPPSLSDDCVYAHESSYSSFSCICTRCWLRLRTPSWSAHCSSIIYWLLRIRPSGIRHIYRPWK